MSRGITKTTLCRPAKLSLPHAIHNETPHENGHDGDVVDEVERGTWADSSPS